MNEKRPLTFSLFLLRLLSGFTGGIAGTLAVFVVYFLFLSLLPAGEETSLSVFFIIVIAFLGTLTANTVAALMVSFLDSEKYSRRKTMLTQVFLFNLILFFLTIPLYMLGITLGITEGIAAMHLLLSAFVSALILEILAGYEYSLVGVYSVSLGIFVTIGLALVAMSLEVESVTLLFAAMPAVWVTLQLVSGITELIYDNFLRFYGVDALNTKTDLGGDSEVDVEDEEEDNTEDETDGE